MMKKIKNKIKNFTDALPFLIVQLSPFIAIIIVLLIAYLIATSNLPDWFKFFLLK